MKGGLNVPKLMMWTFIKRRDEHGHNFHEVIAALQVLALCVSVCVVSPLSAWHWVSPPATRCPAVRYQRAKAGGDMAA